MRNKNPNDQAELKGPCRAVGVPLFGEIEPNANPLRVDHVWLMIDAGMSRPLKLAINTTSIRNRDAGFDPRVRVGLIRETYGNLPERGIFPHPGLDYSFLESTHNIFYEHFEHHHLEGFLIQKIEGAILVEVWGELYSRPRNWGVHQIHCRRASSGVPEDLLGRDGALKFFYRRDNACETFLFKFCGQP